MRPDHVTDYLHFFFTEVDLRTAVHWPLRAGHYSRTATPQEN